MAEDIDGLFVFFAFDMAELVNRAEGEVVTDRRVLQGVRSRCHVCFQDNIIAADATRIGDAAVKTKCKPISHAFHVRCLVRWVKACEEDERDPDCPLCRIAL